MAASKDRKCSIFAGYSSCEKRKVGKDMKNDRIAGVVKLALLVLTVGVAVTLAAMPTAEELAKADPLIQELMKDDLNALRTGKKTREQVGDTAAALAREAQSPAEKYLLFTGAFDQYMRGGSYDKADSALSALREAIPDWKASDEFSLLDKALRSVAFGKGGPVRERHEALKERQQYALKLKKAQTLAQAKPTDKKLQFQVAAYHAALGEWPAALDGFASGSNPACAAAAKLEKESAAPGQVADAWWSAADLKPEFLSSAIRAHAVDLYRKALASNSLAGLQKVAAEKRIAEAESAAVEHTEQNQQIMSQEFISRVGSPATNNILKLLACVYNFICILASIFCVRHEEEPLTQHDRLASQYTTPVKIDKDKLHPCWQRIKHLESLVTDLLNKPASIPSDKEDMIDESLNRIKSIEYDLQKTRKVSILKLRNK